MTASLELFKAISAAPEAPSFQTTSSHSYSLSPGSLRNPARDRTSRSDSITAVGASGLRHGMEGPSTVIVCAASRNRQGTERVR